MKKILISLVALFAVVSAVVAFVLTRKADLCTSTTCNEHGTCSNASGSAACACSGNWDPATNCNNCLAGFQDNDGNGVCLPACGPGGLTIMQNPTANTSVAKYQFCFETSVSTVSIVRMTFAAHLKREGQVIGQALYRNGEISKAILTRSGDRIVAVNSTEDQVVPGTPNVYILELTIDKPDFTHKDLDISLGNDRVSGSTTNPYIFYWANPDGSTKEIRPSYEFRPSDFLIAP